MTVTLDDFVLARIAEEKAAALAATQGKWKLWGMQVMADTGGHSLVAQSTPVADAYSSVRGQLRTGNAQHIIHWDPVHVLADCEARRQMVELRTDDDGPHDWSNGYEEAHIDILRLLALPYADHPDYRQEWKPWI